jgi:hypothetical protein
MVIDVRPLALNIRPRSPADVRPFVPQQAGFTQGIVNDVQSPFHKAALVGVLDAQNKGAASFLAAR